MTTSEVTTVSGEWLNMTGDGIEDETARMLALEAVIRVVVPVVFSVIAVLGFVGNLSVIIHSLIQLDTNKSTNNFVSTKTRL